MAAFDVTDSAMKGYGLVWQERRYLMRLAAFPILIKFVCSITVMMNGYDFDFVKQALLMLPSYFADGWVMSHLVRLIYLGQRWPFRPSGVPENDIAMLRDRAGGIMAGTVFFAVIEFLKTGFMGLLFMTAPPGALPGQNPPAGPVKPGTGEGASITDVAAQAQSSPYTAVAGIVMIIVTIWLVRYLWLYIPAAAGFSGRAYLKRVGGLAGSARLLGAWLICSVPVQVGFIIVATVLLAPLLGLGPQGLSPSGQFIMNAFRVVVDMVMALIVTAGMAFVIRNMFAAERA